MRSGVVWVGKFKDKKSGTIVLEDCSVNMDKAAKRMGVVIGPAWQGWQVCQNGSQKFHMKDVRAFSIYKPTS